MKKLASLLLALALCLSLSIPALAGETERFQFAPYSTEKEGLIDYDPSGTAAGDGWSYDGSTKTLTLNGIQSGSFYENNLDFHIVLAPGSKNRIDGFSGGLSTINRTLTISGTGELLISPTPDSMTGDEDHLFSGPFDALVLEDGLVMTGGHKEEDRFPLVLGEPDHIYEPIGMGVFRKVELATDGKPAQYIRIAPAAGAKPAEAQKPAASSTGFTDVAASPPMPRPSSGPWTKKSPRAKRPPPSAPTIPAPWARAMSFSGGTPDAPRPQTAMETTRTWPRCGP